MKSQKDHWDMMASYPPDASVIDPRDVRGHKNRYITQLRNRAVNDGLRDIRLGSSVLDFGCGTGGLSKSLVQNGYIVTGVDISLGLLARTPERQLGTQASFVQYDGSNLPFADESFDAATTYVVLNHILDDKVLVSTIAEIFRVVKPGGRFVAIEQTRRQPTLDLTVWQHRRTIDGFIDLFERSGFKPRSATVIRNGRMPLIYPIGRGWLPDACFRSLHFCERCMGRLFGVLPWSYSDVCFILDRE